MYKVFIDKSCLLFKKNEKFSTNVEEKYHPSLRSDLLDTFSRYLSSWNKEELPFIADKQPYQRLRLFFDKFVWIEAAGGVVKNTNLHKYLFIKRNGIWDLPKGKIEKDESAEDAAIREVEEECGLEDLSIESSLPDTYHVYHAYGKYWIKKTHWFAMKTTQVKTIPQEEENIESAEWFDAGAVNTIINSTYPSLIDVICQAVPLKA